MSFMRILRAADRTATPWKNGGGLSSVLATYPSEASLDAFDWRISLAEIRGAGPFSRFEGVDRQLAVVSGQLALAVAPRWARFLHSATTPIRLAGEESAYSSPIAGFVNCLNVMTRRGRLRSTLSQLFLRHPTTLDPESVTAVVLAVDPVYVTLAGRRHILSSLDAIAWNPPAPIDLAPVEACGSCYVIEFFDTPVKSSPTTRDPDAEADRPGDAGTFQVQPAPKPDDPLFRGRLMTPPI